MSLIGIEAYAGAHFWARALCEQGHDARPMPTKYLKPDVKTNKNDYIDVEVIAEAVGCAQMRFVQLGVIQRHQIGQECDASHQGPEQ